MMTTHYSAIELGCPEALLGALRQIGRQMTARGASHCQTPVGAFLKHRDHARRRGIAWEFNLEDWWRLWDESGHWAERGRGNAYMMCRKGDEGPYAAGNVFIATGAVNASTSNHRRSNLPMGVRRDGRAYCARRRLDGKNKYLGSFRTPEEAHAAYLRAAPQSEAAA